MQHFWPLIVTVTIFAIIIIFVQISKTFYLFDEIEEIRFEEIKFFMTSSIILALLIIGFCVASLSKEAAIIIKKETVKDNLDNVSNISNKIRFIKDAQYIINNKFGKKNALVHIDIDKFKMINDRLGHNTGDVVLFEIGKVLRDTLKDNHIYCRTYADNFLVFFEYECNQNELLQKINSISKDVENLSIWCHLNLKPVIATGIFFIEEVCDIRIAIDKAKLAKKDMKGGYESYYSIYNENMSYTLIKEKRIEDDMYDAFDNKEFKVFLQPKINLTDGLISGAEALVRWEHPVFGLMAPIKFISIFEKNGFIIKIDKYIFEQVCISLRKWLDNGYDLVPVSVNVSRLHFLKGNFTTDYKDILKKYNIPDGLIEIEITESVAFGNLSEVFSIMKNFRDNGFNISMDDFGSGYSCIGLLREMPINTLKLDKTFLDDIENYKARVIVHDVIKLAKDLNLNVVSEGVESSKQVDFLKGIGCDMAQGFIFSKPIPVDDYEKLILNKRKSYFDNIAYS